MALRRVYKVSLTWTLVFLFLTGASLQCGHGIRGGGRRLRPQKITPLVYKQHVPNVSENTLGASGLSEGKISRDSPKFKDLVEMNDPNIDFRDEEANGSDRIMSKRCKDKLKSLSIAVMNQWPGVKLRVTEAWDEEGTHAKDSLHYEGRAVDITTSDRDRSKYPMLARLAVEAGFDWVYYESRGHIHCSVKSDSSAAIKTGGCFPGDVTVRTESGATKNMSSLQVGEKILTIDSEGRLLYSDVIMFMDRDTQSKVVYYSLVLESGKQLTLTPDHLVFVSSAIEGAAGADISEAVVDFASRVKIGDYVHITRENGTLSPSRVVEVRTATKTGVYAPLTRAGTLVVNDVVASCYAVINNHQLAHAVFAPLRAAEHLKDFLGWGKATAPSTSPSSASEGIHWYPKLFHGFAPYVLNKNMFLSRL